MMYLGFLLLIVSATASPGYQVKGATVGKISLSNDFSAGTFFIKVVGGEVTSVKNGCAATSWSFTHKIEDNEISKAQFSMLLIA